MIALAEDLKKCKDEFAIIHLVGRSCGAGTAINCLVQLINYNDVYWQESNITHQDASDIIAAINRGSIFVTVPFLHLEKARAISIPSTILGTASLMGTCAFAYYIAKRTNNPYVTKLNATGAFLATNYMFGKYFKKAWSSFFNHIGARVISNMHYDSFHPSPLDSIPYLKGKFTCPILLDIRAHDGVLDDPDEDIVIPIR